MRRSTWLDGAFIAGRLATVLLGRAASEPKPLLVGLGGDGGLGKTSLGEQIRGIDDSILLISTDGFLRDRKDRGGYALGECSDSKFTNFPPLLNSISEALGRGSNVIIPQYDHRRGSVGSVKMFDASRCRCIIVEGSIVANPIMWPMFDIRLLIDGPDGTRRRLRRVVDLNERGYTAAQFRSQWRYHLAAYRNVIAPRRQIADLCLDVSKDRQYKVAGGSLASSLRW